MKKNNSFLGVFFLVLCGLCIIQGCAREELMGRDRAFGEIRYTTSIAQTPSTKSAVTQKVFDLVSEDGTITLPVTMIESDGMPESVSTKGELVNGEEFPKDSIFFVNAYDGINPIFDTANERVEWNGENWTMNKFYLWPQATPLNFYAYSNLPSKKEKAEGEDDYAWVTINAEDREQVLHHTVPTYVAEQKDIMMAVYSGTGNNKGEAELQFYHPLCAILFTTEDPAIEASISITMEGVYYSGSVSQSIDNPSGFDWESDGNHTVIQDNHGLPLTVHGNVQGDPFLLIPQDLTGTRRISLRMVLVIHGHNVTLNQTIDGVTWKAGKTYTYKIGYSGGLTVGLDMEELPSETEYKSVTAFNNDVREVYVRALALGYIMDDNGKIKGTWLNDDGSNKGLFVVDSGIFGDPNEYNVEKAALKCWNENWFMLKNMDDDFYYYYYKMPLKVRNGEDPSDLGWKTTPLFNSYSINVSEHFLMDIAVQAVEYDKNQEYVKSAWGENVARLLETF